MARQSTIRFRAEEAELCASALLAKMTGRASASEMMRDLQRAETLAFLAKQDPPFPTLLLKDAPAGTVADAFLTWVSMFTSNPHLLNGKKYRASEVRMEDGKAFCWPVADTEVEE